MIKTAHPEMGKFPAPRVQLFLDKAKRRVSTTSWGARADDAIIELTCHLLQVACNAEDQAGAATAGPISAESVGDISVDYADTSASSKFDSGELGTTAYGRTFAQMRREIISDRCL